MKKPTTVDAGEKSGIRDEYRALDLLLPDPANYNRASQDPEQVATLASQILEVGFTSPFLVDEATGIMAAGHRRRLALMKLRAEGRPEPAGIAPGWMVPCRVGGWTEIQRLKVLIGDNPDPGRIDYDMEKLGRALGALRDQHELRGSGYDDVRVEKMLDGVNAAGKKKKGGGGGSTDEVAAAPETFMVVVHCTSEEEQVDLLEELGERGLKVQAVVA